MKRLLSFFAAVAIISSAVRAEVAETADTVKIIENPSTVTVVTSGNSTKVTVKGTSADRGFAYEYETSESVDDDFPLDIELPFKKFGKSRKKHKSSVIFMEGIFVGCISPRNAPDGMLASWELGMPFILGYSYQTAKYAPKLSVGIGMGFRWYNVGDGYGVTRNGDALSIFRIPEGTGNPSSRFTTTSILVPFALQQRIYGNFGMSLMAILDFNVNTDAFFKYYEGGKDGVRYTERYKGFHQRVFRCDFMASIGFIDAISAYVRYSPTKMFKAGYGPRFSEISAGIQLFF